MDGEEQGRQAYPQTGRTSKQCLREAYPEETSTVPPKRAWWVKLVDIIQFMWETGSILTKLGWNVLVLIPKVNADNWEIGIL